MPEAAHGALKVLGCPRFCRHVFVLPGCEESVQDSQFHQRVAFFAKWNLSVSDSDRPGGGGGNKRRRMRRNLPNLGFEPFSRIVSKSDF